MLDRLTCPQQLCGRPNNSPNLGRQPVSAWHVCPIVGHQQKSWPKKWSHPGYRHPLNVFWSEVISFSLPQVCLACVSDRRTSAKKLAKKVVPPGIQAPTQCFLV